MREYFVEAIGARKQRNFSFVLRALLLCVVVGGVGYMLVLTSEGGVDAAATYEEQPVAQLVDVLIPKRLIEVGQRVAPSHFTSEARPRDQVPAEAVHDFSQIHGYFVTSALLPGEPVVSTAVSSENPNRSIVARIPDGFRAVTISVDETSGVEGWAYPGARVDVTWTADIRGSKQVSIIVENAKILSAERTTENKDAIAPEDGKIPSTVTLLVSAKDAAKIHLASSHGRLNLSLRGVDDAGKSDPIGNITVSDLVGRKAKEGGEDEDVEGTLRMRGANGGIEEWVIRRGKLVLPTDAKKAKE